MEKILGAAMMEKIPVGCYDGENTGGCYDGENTGGLL